MQAPSNIRFYAIEQLLLASFPVAGMEPGKLSLRVDGIEVPKPYLAILLTNRQDIFLAGHAETLARSVNPRVELIDEEGRQIAENTEKPLASFTYRDMQALSGQDPFRIWRALLWQAPKTFPFLSDYLKSQVATTLACPQIELKKFPPGIYYLRCPWPERPTGLIAVELQRIGHEPSIKTEAYAQAGELHWLGVAPLNWQPEEGEVWRLQSKDGSSISLALPAIDSKAKRRSALTYFKQSVDKGDLLDYLQDRLTQTQENAANSPAQSIHTLSDLDSKSPAFPYYGRLEGVRGDRLTGWALSAKTPNYPLRLGIFLDELKLCEIPTQMKIHMGQDGEQQDAWGDKAGFAINLAERLTPELRERLIERHEVRLSVRIHGTQIELENSPLVYAVSQLLAKPEVAEVSEEISAKRYNGKIETNRGRYVSGWALDRADSGKSLTLEFYLDGQFVGCTTANQRREDLRNVSPDNPRHGFEFVVPEKHLQHLIGGNRGKLTVREQLSKRIVFEAIAIDGLSRPRPLAVTSLHRQLDKVYQLLQRIEQELPQLRYQSSYHIDEYDEYFRQHYQISPAYRQAMRTQSAAFRYTPLISVVIPVYRPALWMLEAAVESVCQQTYPNWELLLIDDGSHDDSIRGLAQRHAQDDPRIKLLVRDDNGGIAAATNDGIKQSKGDYVAFMDQDDLLTEDALYCIVKSLQSQTPAVLYSDEDRLDEDGNHILPMFKPDFNYDLLLGYNYVCHLLVVSREALKRVKGLGNGCEGCQDHDLLLRLTEHYPAGDFQHIPRVLYHWRITQGSVSQTRSTQKALLSRIADTIQTHLDRRQTGATVLPDQETLSQHGIFASRVYWPLPESGPKVSIIIPTKDALNLVTGCITSLLNSTDYQNYEILLVDHQSEQPLSRKYLGDLARDERVQLRQYRGHFNWSAINNYAVTQSTGEILVFLNNDTMVLARNWLTELVSHAIRPGVGAVGAKLLYEDGTIQHAGVYLGINGVADHAFMGEPATSQGYLGRTVLTADISAVTGACLACRREVFEQVRGFDAINLAVAFNDVDFCMKVTDAGYRIVWTPHALLYHLESKSRGQDNTPEKLSRIRREIGFMEDKWKSKLKSDPFYNPHFEYFNPSMFTHLAAENRFEPDSRLGDAATQG